MRTKEELLATSDGIHDFEPHWVKNETLIDIRDILANIAGALTPSVPCMECGTTTGIHNPGCKLGHMLD